MRKIALLIFVSWGLVGCVVGQTIPLDYQSQATSVPISTSVGLNVSDDRPYVLSGDKQPTYLGIYRAGFGNTWDVNTKGKVPLADQMQEDLIEAFKSLGVDAGSASGRAISVSIVDWNFDSYINGRFEYEIAVKLTDASGAVLYNQTLKDETVIKGNFMTGAKSAFEKGIPVEYDKVIVKLTRENQGLLNALRQ